MMESSRDIFPFFYNQNITPPTPFAIYSLDDIRHRGKDCFLSTSKSVQSVCQDGRTKIIRKSEPCHLISRHLLGLTDALLGCLPRLLSESARLTSKAKDLTGCGN